MSPAADPGELGALCRLTKQRKAIITALQTLTMEGDNGYGSAVDKTDELRRNMQQEARHLSFGFWLPFMSLDAIGSCIPAQPAIEHFGWCGIIWRSRMSIHSAIHDDDCHICRGSACTNTTTGSLLWRSSRSRRRQPK
jgi:hypothetical protein